MSQSVPYPLPADWPIAAIPPGRPVRLAIGVALAAAAAVVAVFFLRAGEWGIGAWVTAGACIVLSVLGITGDGSAAARGVPEMLNAVVLTRAEHHPADSWIHFFRERGPGLWTASCFSAMGVVGLGGFGWAAGGEIGDDRAVALVVLGPLLLVAAVFALAGGIAFFSRWRHSSFARRPIGLAIGATGVTRFYLDEAREYAWDDIIAVRTTTTVFDKKTKDASMVLHLDTAAERNALELEIGGFVAHPWLIYTAVRFWHEHPEARGELSTTFAQRRIAGWRDAMFGRERVGGGG